ncbi:hypothetical protein MNBD_DELTA03-1145 [hydrothermal vent metagenome]|uniref:Uncharacterized protein n=1 Tax=hydrothermal vent metagenome TaxID=652676 RepID=A0A3B0VX81_9ZZZZ
MRPARLFFYIVGMLLVIDLVMYAWNVHNERLAADGSRAAIVTAALGLTDLCLATEARYTRHPVLADGVVPFMDYPGEIEHFPTGSFWAPPVRAGRLPPPR